MSNKTKLIKRSNQGPKSQNEIIKWFLDQPFGKDVLSSLGSKVGIQNVTAKENKPSLSFANKKLKKKIILPKIYFGTRIEQQPWLIGFYLVPRSKNTKKTDKLVSKYLASLDTVSSEAGLKTALLVIADREMVKDEAITTALVVTSWTDFVNIVKSSVDKNIESIPPFKHDSISKWIEQWNFTHVFNAVGKESFENLNVSVKVPYKIKNSSFVIKHAEKGSSVRVRGHLKGTKVDSSKLVLDLALKKKGTKKWRRQWDVAIPNLEHELVEDFTNLGYTPEVKSAKPVEELNKKSLKKLAKKKTRLQFEFPIQLSSNQWMINEKPLDKSLHEITSTYVNKVSSLLVWKPEEAEPVVVET